jgi:DNA-binding NarL/FixJ family response regulator
VGTVPLSPNSEAPIRVLLVDDHKSMLWGLERLIEGEKPHMQVIGKANDKIELFASLKLLKPDVVLLDVDLNGECSLDFLEELLQESQAHVLVLTASQDPVVHQRAIINGASGVVLKTENADVILRAIKYVHAGELWFDRVATGRLLRSLSAPAPTSEKAIHLGKIATLTHKERQVISAMALVPGARNKVVADRLFMSEHTLRNHLTEIYAKLDLENRLELCMFAIEHKL